MPNGARSSPAPAVEPLQLLSLKAISPSALVGAATENEPDINAETERLANVLRFSDRLRSVVLSGVGDDVGEDARRRIERNVMCSCCCATFPSVRCQYLAALCDCGGMYICADCRERAFPDGSGGRGRLSEEERSRVSCPAGCSDGARFSDAASFATAKVTNVTRPRAVPMVVDLVRLLAIDLALAVGEIADAGSRGALIRVAKGLRVHVYARRPDLRSPEDEEPCHGCGEMALAMELPAVGASPRSVRWSDQQECGFKSCECCKVWLCQACIKTSDRVAPCGYCDKLICPGPRGPLRRPFFYKCDWNEDSFGRCSEEECDNRGLICEDCKFAHRKSHTGGFLKSCQCGEISDKCPECIEKLGLMTECSECCRTLLCERCIRRASFFNSKEMPYCRECFNQKAQDQRESDRQYEEWLAEMEDQRWEAEREAEREEEEWRAEMEAQGAQEEAEAQQAQEEAERESEGEYEECSAEIEAQEAQEEAEAQ